MIATAPHIGNTGWSGEDSESSRIWVAGYVAATPLGSPPIGGRDETLNLSCALRASSACVRSTRPHSRTSESRAPCGWGSPAWKPTQQRWNAWAQPSMVGAHLADEVSTTERFGIDATRR